ncbi:MAG: glycosyltransferase [Chitinophagaceae bacterium]|nr:MAG: glycosyltransferase [Chitinophagaceae bacterium]
MKQPEITVLMPAYNAAEYIANAVRSVLAQTFADFELLVVDDGSTDDTASIVRSFTDGRIRLLQQPNGGVATALNVGLLAARAPLIVRFDADDLCAPERLHVQWELMQRNPQLVIAGTAVEYVDAHGTPVFSWQPPAYDHAQLLEVLPRTCPFIHSSVVYRRSAVLAAGGYPEGAHTFEDHLLWTKLLPTGRGLNLPEPLLQVRLNVASVTIDERWRPRSFRRIKARALRDGSISTDDSARLAQIIHNQSRPAVKEGAYHALLGKKFLWNNYDPPRARASLLRALSCNPFYAAGYGLLFASYLPPAWIRRGYHLFKNLRT